MSKRGGYIAPTAVCRTTGRDGCRLFQLPKADCGVDIVAQDRAARLLIAEEHEFDCFTKQRLAESRFPLGAFAADSANRFSLTTHCLSRINHLRI